MLAAAPRCDILPLHARGLLSPASPHPSSALGRLAWSLGPLILWEHKDVYPLLTPRGTQALGRLGSSILMGLGT